MDTLISADWLAGALRADDLVVVDASMHLPAAERDARAEFASGHIPGARFLHLASLNNPEDPAPKAVPTAEQFAERLASLGIASGDRVVLCDDSMIKTSARAWFIFTLHGWEKVAILNGGLAAWKAGGHALEDGEPEIAASTISASDLATSASRLRDKNDMLANCESCGEQVVDARDAGRFTGEIDDSVHGLAGGHIPGACNLFFRDLLDEDGKYRPDDELRAQFEKAGLDLDQPITASCGSGVTASVVLFAADRIGASQTALYDGSWLDWGSDPNTPKETGPSNKDASAQ